MQIIQELRAGTVHFIVQPDGTESFSTRPPTALNLKAARALEELVQVLQGLERANQTLTQQNQTLELELQALRNPVNSTTDAAVSDAEAPQTS